MGRVVRSMEIELENVSNDELFKAAEALVDAAICCREVSRDSEISESTRNLLIRAVYEDPRLTPHLFLA